MHPGGHRSSAFTDPHLYPLHLEKPAQAGACELLRKKELSIVFQGQNKE